MEKTGRRPPFIWRLIRRFNQRMVSSYHKRDRAGNLVLLLTTTGRKSGLPRVTPLQYEEDDSVIYIGSARGQDADWFRNILAHPEVKIQIKEEQFEGLAEPITDPGLIADFLEMRLQRHPIIIRLIMTAEGLPLVYDRARLEQFTANKAVVAIRPTPNKKE